MASILARLWTGFVGAVAGASLGLLVAIVLVMSQFSLDSALYGVAACAVLGGLIAFWFGKPESTG